MQALERIAPDKPVRPNQIAKREYSRFVARQIGVDLADVEAAVGRGSPRSSPRPIERDKPLDRHEAELLRVAMGNTGELGDLSESDFLDPRLREGFKAVADRLSETRPGEPVDIGLAPAEVQPLLRSLILDPTPPASGAEMMARLRQRRLGVEIDRLEAELEKQEPGSETHSESLRRLIALQKDKRSGPDT